MDKLKILLYFLLITNITQCQDIKKTPEFHVEICAPANKYEIEFVSDRIKTLEGNPAGLPYGGTSGNWGQSGSRWTEQHGTPIGADITYYAGYEDTFYRLDVDFPIDTIKDYMERAYANGEALPQFTKEPLERYKRLGRFHNFAAYNSPYNSFSDIVFGFAPKGMVVVWLRFGSVQIELGRYQAEVIKDDKELEKKLFASWSMNRKEVKERDFNTDASPQEWDNYRVKYSYAPVFSSENKALRLFHMFIQYTNGEQELFLRPFIDAISYEKRAIPKELNFIWETGKDQQFVGRAYFNWEKTNEVFKKTGNQAKLEFKIAPDSSTFEILLNNHPVPTDSIRIFKYNEAFNDSYK